MVYRDVAPGEHVLYDVLSDRSVGVDEAGLAAVARWADAAPSEAERESADALRDLGMVVDGAGEDASRLSLAEARAHQGAGSRTLVTLLPTLACNLACTYCIQKDTPEAEPMGDETEAATVAFVLGRVDAARSPRLTVLYIGGEPLARKDVLRRTARAFAEGMRARGGTFDWELTTNGVGLRPELVRELLACGPGAIKVTLDGHRETHDAARVRRNGRGTFDEIFDNLVAVAAACPEVELRVGGNFREGQEASYERLLDALERAGLRGRLASVRFKPVIDTRSCASCDGGAQADELVQLGRSARRRGLSPAPDRDGVDALGACELHWDDAWTIDPAGRVYRCFAMAGRAEMAIGTVFDGVRRPDPLLAGRPWERDPRCGACPFISVCFGGCLGGAYLQSGRTDQVFCRREHFEATFREAVVRRYLAEFHPQSSDVSRAA